MAGEAAAIWRGVRVSARSRREQNWSCTACCAANGYCAHHQVPPGPLQSALSQWPITVASKVVAPVVAHLLCCGLTRVDRTQTRGHSRWPATRTASTAQQAVRTTLLAPTSALKKDESAAHTAALGVVRRKNCFVRSRREQTTFGSGFGLEKAWSERTRGHLVSSATANCFGRTASSADHLLPPGSSRPLTLSPSVCSVYSVVKIRLFLSAVQISSSFAEFRG